VPIVELRRITKVFPPRTVAVDDVSLVTRPAEIHAIVGENGAGKSTLMKVLAAHLRHEAGEILIDGRPASFHSPRGAMASGIGMVHQEILLVPEYTVWQNVVLGREPVGPLGRIRAGQARAQVERRIEEYGLGLESVSVVRNLSVAARQKVEILKLLYRDVSILILDEPTAVLTPQEVPQLFGELRRLRDRGRTILLVSHRLDEVLDLADRVTIMRRGRIVDTVEAAGTVRADLARLIVGRDVGPGVRSTVRPRGAAVLTAAGLCTGTGERPSDLKDVSLTVSGGEVVGVAGIEGNGQLELVGALMGLCALSAGSLRVFGTEIARAPIRSRRRMIAFVSQDRRGMGAAPAASLADNAIMTHHFLSPPLSSPGAFLHPARARRHAEALAQRLSVSMSSVAARFSSLSGGNQQKVILGRELELGCPVLVLDQPTRGLDVGSTEFVQSEIDRVAQAGRAILLISAEIEELLLLSDRILVLHRGRIVADLDARSTDSLEVGRLMLVGKSA
jgi:simple sugar transport system ATP-binding protein